jgi:hypothetical protein
VSLTSRGSDALTLDDITAALGSHRHQEAREIFASLDENDNGDIRLGELVPTVVEIGTTRRNIYAGMHDVDHALNTFDWIICMILALGMLFFIRTSVPIREGFRLTPCFQWLAGSLKSKRCVTISP